MERPELATLIALASLVVFWLGLPVPLAGASGRKEPAQPARHAW